MGVNESFVGRVYPPEGVYEVGREKIREFAEAVAGDGAVHPAHRDPEAARALGHPDVIAPPTFAVIVAQRSDARLVRDPEAGIDFTRVVHGEQKFVHHRPVVAGDRLVATLHVDSVRGGRQPRDGHHPQRDRHRGRRRRSARPRPRSSCGVSA